MAAYEVEVKSLLGTKENAEVLVRKMKELDSSCACRNSYTQINHYFEGGDLLKLAEKMESYIDTDNTALLKEIAERGTKVSIRSREMNNEVRFVVKASVGDDTSDNGVRRIEIEEVVPLSMDELDALIKTVGYDYQAKWSRSREEYTLGDVDVCLDKNAGYGYLAEFECTVEGEDALTEAHEKIRMLMNDLGVEELPQDRLERMFEHYNQHWPEYYGTDKVFTIE